MSEQVSEELRGRMRRDWDERAVTNPRWFIASSVEGGEAEFHASGVQDVAFFFSGLEDLLTPKTDVLDLGCGLGRMDRVIAPRVRSLVGVDVSPEMIRQAQARLAEQSNVRFLAVSGSDFQGVEPASLDLVFSHIVLQHVPREVAASYLRDALRVLRPGGDFVFQVPEPVGTLPPDPPASDTFGMRYYREAEICELAESMGYVWKGAARYFVADGTPPFTQLRIHLRTRSP